MYTTVLTKITDAQNEVTLSFHKVRGLSLAVYFDEYEILVSCHCILKAASFIGYLLNTEQRGKAVGI